MLIRIFGIANPTGHYLYNKILKEKYKNIFCYSRSNCEYLNIDLAKKKPDKLIKKGNQDETWISLCPIWIFSEYLRILINCNEFEEYKIKKIIACSSSSEITKKYSWHKYDKSLTNKINLAEQTLKKISKKNYIFVSIIRPTMIYGNSGNFKDNNINKISTICKKLPIIFFPKDSGERQPIHISQLANIINQEISISNNKKKFSILNIGGDEILTYENMIRNIIKKKNINVFLFVIKTELFFFLMSPFLFINPRQYSEILRIGSNLSGFTKSKNFLKNASKKFIDFI